MWKKTNNIDNTAITHINPSTNHGNIFPILFIILLLLAPNFSGTSGFLIFQSFYNYTPKIGRCQDKKNPKNKGVPTAQCVKE